MENEEVLELTRTRKNTPPPYSFQECKKQLMSEFRNIFGYDIGIIIKHNRGHYAESHMALRLVMDKIKNQLQNNGNGTKALRFGVVNLILKYDNGESVSTQIESMIRERVCLNVCTNSAELEQEVQRVKEQIKMLDEAARRQAALSLLEEDYSKMGQLIECACCFGECVFDNMAQCTEGHLVCVECLNSFINEIAFGTGKIDLGCMMPECTAEYPPCELRRCLDTKMLSKLEERTLMENLNAAQIKDLVRCPYCDFAAILPDTEEQFSCVRDTCGKVTCRKCSNDWKDHVGKTCSMVETRDETSLRKEYEEKMTKAKVRTCTNCSTKFTKEAGCNRMYCRCGMTMCYICRTPGVAYTHFCMHFYISGNCTQCNDCPLWTNTEEDEEMAIQEIKREADMKRKALGYAGDRDIGVPAAKKAKKAFFYFF